MNKYPTANRKFIILEGCDRTGKSTAWLSINELTKYSHYVLDRGPIGFLAYDIRYKKGLDLFSCHYKDLVKLSDFDDIVILYFYADKEILQKRVESTGHEFVNYKDDLAAYEEALDLAEKIGIKIHKLDTTEIHVHNHIKNLISEGVL